MKNFANNGLTINNTAVMRAIDAMIVHSLGYDAAMATVSTELRADRLSVDDARLAFALGLQHHKPAAYKGQLNRITGKIVASGKPLVDDKGNEVAGSKCTGSLIVKVNAMIRDVKGNQRNTKKASDSIEVPRAVQKLADELVALCNEYEGTAKLIATAIANAKAK